MQSLSELRNAIDELYIKASREDNDLARAILYNQIDELEAELRSRSDEEVSQ